MKRSMLIIALSLVSVMFLFACAADYNFVPDAPAAEAEPAPAPETSFDSDDEGSFFVAPAEAPAVDDWFLETEISSPDLPEPVAPAPPAISIAPPESALPPIISTTSPPVPAEAPITDSAGTQGILPLITPYDDRNRLMVYTVDVQLQTTEFMDGIGLLVRSVAELGGFVETAQVHGRDLFSTEEDDEVRNAFYIFRIPGSALARFIVVMETNFNLLHLSQWSSDVTTTHVYGELTLADLQVRENELMAELDNILDIPADSEYLEELDNEDITLIQMRRNVLEEELRNIRTDIRNREFSQAAIDDTINYSTVFVTVVEAIVPAVVEEAPDPDFGERMGEAAASGFEEIIGALQGLLVFLISALPVLIILALIGVPTLLITRKILRKTEPERAKKKAAKEQAWHDANSAYHSYQSGQNQAWNTTSQQPQSPQPPQE